MVKLFFLPEKTNCAFSPFEQFWVCFERRWFVYVMGGIKIPSFFPFLPPPFLYAPPNYRALHSKSLCKYINNIHPLSGGGRDIRFIMCQIWKIGLYYCFTFFCITDLKINFKTFWFKKIIFPNIIIDQTWRPNFSIFIIFTRRNISHVCLMQTLLQNMNKRFWYLFHVKTQFQIHVAKCRHSLI